MRPIFLLAAILLPALAQNPSVRLTNATRPSSTDFQIGDRFEIVLTAAANQPISVRTTMHGRTDWSPVIGWTDLSGHWSTTRQFEKSDFGDWSEVWTVEGKLANPALHFAVTAPCLKGGQAFMMISGLLSVMTCATAEGSQTFGTSSDPFHTPDGRLIPGRDRSNMTATQYHTEILESFILGNMREAPRKMTGEAGTLLTQLIGPNALNEKETQNALVILHDAHDKDATLALLRNLLDSTDQPSLKQQIAETMAFVQTH
jgi:hypothetical protein